jgi:hypothetical protein
MQLSLDGRRAHGYVGEVEVTEGDAGLDEVSVGFWESLREMIESTGRRGWCADCVRQGRHVQNF